MTVCFGFDQISRRIEDLALRELELSPLPLARELGSLVGEFRGKPARLSARAYAGRRHAYARFVELVGEGLEIANILIVARPERPFVSEDDVADGEPDDGFEESDPDEGESSEGGDAA